MPQATTSLPYLRQPTTFGFPVTPSRPSRRNQSCQCNAILTDGQECPRMTIQPNHTFCPVCHREKNQLYEKYKCAEAEYNKLKRPPDGFGPEVRRAKVSLGEEVVKLRDEVNKRFFSDGPYNRSHIKRILHIQNEIRQLREETNTSRESSPLCQPQVESACMQETPVLVGFSSLETNDSGFLKGASRSASEAVEEERPKVYRSLLATTVPMEDLDHLPRDHPVVELKQFYMSMCQGFIQKLYEIAPSLCDVENGVPANPSEGRRPPPDDGDLVVRFVFREVIVWRQDTETLACATEMDSIDSFLRTRGFEELEWYVKFFKHFANGRPDTWHFLRNAISDLLLPPTASSISILGGRVATGDDERRIDLKGWDILHDHFSNIVSGGNVGAFCTRFEELLLVKKLMTLNRYGSQDTEELGWLNPENDVSQECQGGIFLGFNADTKGYCDPQNPLPDTTAEDGITSEMQFRNYVTGRMGKTDPLAKALIEELGNRAAALIVIVYDGPPTIFGDNVVSETEKDPWVKRKRSARNGQRLEDAKWEVEWPFESILHDLSMIRSFTKEVMTDFFHFIVIDRIGSTSNNILTVIEDALMKLSGDPPFEQILTNFIHQSIPSAEQDAYLKVAHTIGSDKFIDSTSTSLSYDRNRLRAWNIDLDFIEKRVRDPISSTRSARRLASAVISDMESQGLVTLQKTYEPPRGRPLIIKGSDGNYDVYFHHLHQPLTKEKEQDLIARGIRNIQPLKCLDEFAASYASQHGNAIFAKGKIHVHYCAWPVPYPAQLNFRTIEGHIYRWNVMPFDIPYSSRIWQYYLDECMNKRFTFALFIQTTFVVCATGVEDAQVKVRQIVSEAEKHNWKLSVPTTPFWSSDIESLSLRNACSGIYPTEYKKMEGEKDSKAGNWCIIQ